MVGKNLDSKLNEFYELHSQIKEYRKELVKNGLDEAMYKNLEVVISKPENRKPHSVNIYIDGESFDDSELLEVAKDRDPKLYKKYREGLEELDKLGGEKGIKLFKGRKRNIQPFVSFLDKYGVGFRDYSEIIIQKDLKGKVLSEGPKIYKNSGGREVDLLSVYRGMKILEALPEIKEGVLDLAYIWKKSFIEKKAEKYDQYVNVMQGRMYEIREIIGKNKFEEILSSVPKNVDKKIKELIENDIRFYKSPIFKAVKEGEITLSKNTKKLMRDYKPESIITRQKYRKIHIGS